MKIWWLVTTVPWRSKILTADLPYYQLRSSTLLIVAKYLRRMSSAQGRVLTGSAAYWNRSGVGELDLGRLFGRRRRNGFVKVWIVARFPDLRERCRFGECARKRGHMWKYTDFVLLRQPARAVSSVVAFS